MIGAARPDNEKGSENQDRKNGIGDGKYPSREIVVEES